MGERQRLPVQTKSRVGTPAMLPPEPVVDEKMSPFVWDRCLHGTLLHADHASRKCRFMPVHLHSGVCHAHKPCKFRRSTRRTVTQDCRGCSSPRCEPPGHP